MPRAFTLPPPERLPGDYQVASGSGPTYHSRSIAPGDHALADDQRLWGSIQGGRLDRPAVAALAGLPGLHALFLGDVAIDDDALAGLAELADLGRLDLTRVALTPAWTELLPRLPALSRVAIQEVAVDDAIAGGLAAIPGLTSLSLASGAATSTLGDEGLRAIGRRPALTHLRVAGMPAIRGDGLDTLAEAGLLTSLELTICGALTEAQAVAHLPRLARLILLDLSFDPRLGDPTIAALAGLPALEALMIRALSRVSGGGLQPLAALPQLRSLHLSTSRRMKKIRQGDLDALQAARPALVISRT